MPIKPGSYELAATLYQHDGAALRLGPDEELAENIPAKSPEFGTEVPGWGFAEASITLKRPAAMSDLDANLFAAVHVYDAAGQTVYRGRVAGFPRLGQTELEIDCEGPLAHLDDNSTARMVYRDLDLSNWQGMSRSRQLVVYATLAGAAFNVVEDGTTEIDSQIGEPAIRLGLDGEWTVGKASELWYDAGPGLTVSSVYFKYTARNLTASYTGVLSGFTDDTGSGAVTGTDVVTGAASTGSTTESPGTRFVAFISYLNASAVAVSADRELRLANVAVYGNHGLTKRGTEPSAGFYASDIVTNALGRWAPLIDIATGGIESSTYVIPHLAFREDTTARAVIEAVSLFGAAGLTPPDWGYYEDGFFWRTPGTYGRTWRVRRDQAVIPLDEGPSGETRCNGFKVSYQDAAGATKTVGPPGSGSDTETTSLQDTSPTNPVNAAGIPYRIGSRDVGITTQEGAILIGQLLLAEANSKQRKGSIEIKGVANDEAGNEYPAYLVRAGDYVVVEDDEDTTPRKIVSTRYADRTVTCSLDNGKNTIDALIARLDSANRAAGF